MPIASYLADTDILGLAAAGQELVSPFDPSCVRSASVDLHLSGEQLAYSFQTYSVGDEITDADVKRSHFDVVELSPQQTVHVGLVESIHIPSDCLGWVFARSSLTRIGLRIAPVFMNPGYRGILPLTITNAASFDIKLISGVRVAQLVCARLAVTPSRDYASLNGKYAEENASHSLIHSDEEIKAALERVLGRYITQPGFSPLQ